jgi:ubiquinone/menaquinone biosynthesis C-methylase UbiE
VIRRIREKARVLSRAFWSLHARTWDDDLDDRREARVSRLLTHAHPGERLVDLGCGTGAYARLVARRGLDVVGLDFAPAMLARARAQAPQVRFVQANLNDPLPFEDGEFDHALCIAALQCVRDPHRFVAEVHRVLRPGGTFLLAVVAPAARSRRPAGRGAAQHAFWFAKLAASRTPAVRRYTLDELRVLLHNARFGVVDGESSSGLVEVLAHAERTATP